MINEKYISIESLDAIADKRKAEDGDAPKYVAEAHEDLAAAEAVGERAHQQGGQRSGNGTCHDHQRNIFGPGIEHLVDENIEVHILNDPRDLSDKTEYSKGDPKAGLCGIFHKILTFATHGCRHIVF